MSVISKLTLTNKIIVINTIIRSLGINNYGAFISKGVITKKGDAVVLAYKCDSYLALIEALNALGVIDHTRYADDDDSHDHVFIYINFK